MEEGKKYYLGDGVNYFVYRRDKYNPETIRADLFNMKDEISDKMLVKGGIINANYSHKDVINYFEFRISNFGKH